MIVDSVAEADSRRAFARLENLPQGWIELQVDEGGSEAAASIARSWLRRDSLKASEWIDSNTGVGYTVRPEKAASGSFR